uniref:Fucosyltransferase N-terminal domain-containing protein n=1 Tax=Dendroctonus ponderosae TaxID=77166 RepID=A0AAR5PHD8_DENPD
MPPRLTPRKFFLAFLIIISVTLLVGSRLNFSYFSRSPQSAALEHEQETQTPKVQERREEIKEVLEREREDEGEEKGEPPEKPFFLRGGTRYPSKSKGPVRLFPEQADGDRVVDQLMYVPEDYEGFDTPEKTILLYSGFGSWGQSGGSGIFHSCPVNRCSLTGDRGRAVDADAILYRDHVSYPGVDRPANQVWILYHLECPYHTQSIKVPDSINWTATYRRDSDIVAPYERWTYFDPQVRQKAQNRTMRR